MFPYDFFMHPYCYFIPSSVSSYITFPSFSLLSSLQFTSSPLPLYHLSPANPFLELLLTLFPHGPFLYFWALQIL